MMRETSPTNTEKSARSRLIAAGERLFSDRGIDAVSMREIAIAARCGDNNAVQYNFGSKDGLLSAIFNERVVEMEPARLSMLQKAEDAGLALDPLTMLSALCLPHLGLADDQGRHPYAGFLIQFVTRYWSPVNPLLSATNAMPGLEAVVAYLKNALGDIHPDLATGRIMFCNIMFQTMLVRWDHATRLDRTVTLPVRVRDVLEAASASLRVAPNRPWESGLAAGWLEDFIANSTR